MQYRMIQDKSESDMAFAIRRLKYAAIAALVLVGINLMWIPVFPAADNHGPLVWFVTGLLSLLIFLVDLVVAVSLLVLGLIPGWLYLESKNPFLRRWRHGLSHWATTLMSLVGVLLSAYMILAAMATGTIRQYTRYGRGGQWISLDTDPLFFFLYVLLWLAIGGACFAGLWFRKRFVLSKT
jgi:hypothetical protein